MMHRPRTFKLIVQNSDICVSILKFFDSNIQAINHFGAVIKIEKIENDDLDDEFIDALKKKGIARLPALITPEGKSIIGSESIISFVERTLKKASNISRVTEPDDLEKHLITGLFAPNQHGKLEVRKDDDEDEKIDFEKKMTEFRSRLPIPPDAAPPTAPSPRPLQPAHQPLSPEDDIDKRMLDAWLDNTASATKGSTSDSSDF